MATKATMAEATCVFEKYFPPSFFDISIHLLVHLCGEALQCGPVQYRWMYPFERLMKTFKDYVKIPGMLKVQLQSTPQKKLPFMQRNIFITQLMEGVNVLLMNRKGLPMRRLWGMESL